MNTYIGVYTYDDTFMRIFLNRHTEIRNTAQDNLIVVYLGKWSTRHHHEEHNGERACDERAPFRAWRPFRLSLKGGSAMEVLAEALRASRLHDRATSPIDCHPR